MLEKKHQRNKCSKMNDRQDFPFDRKNLISSDHHDRWIGKKYLQRCMSGNILKAE